MKYKLLPFIFAAFVLGACDSTEQPASQEGISHESNTPSLNTDKNDSPTMKNNQPAVSSSGVAQPGKDQ